MPIFSHSTPTAHNVTGSDAETSEANKRFSRRPGVLSLASLSKLGSSQTAQGSGNTQHGTASAAAGAASLGATPPTTPPASAVRNPGVSAVVQADPSRLSQFSLRLNELVNKAFVASQQSVSSIAHSGTSPFTGYSISVPRIQNISYGNNRLPNRIKVIEMTRLVIDELHSAAQEDPYLLRAVSRTVLKTLSQFVARIESQLVSSRTDPTALQIPASLRGTHHVPAAMEFNLALISLEWIVEESLERCLEGLPPLAFLHSPNILMPTAAEGMAQPPMPSYVHDILSPLREQMEASIIHVVQPLLVTLKSSITACLMRANTRPFQPQTSPPLLSDFDAQHGNPRVPWYKELEERLDAAYRLLMLRIVDRCGQDGQAWFISVAIHTIWKGLVIITARSVFAPASVVEAEFAHTFGRTPSAMPSSAVLNALLSGEQSKRVPTPTQLAHALRSVSRHSSSRKWRASVESGSGTRTPEPGTDNFKSWCGHFALPATDADCFVVNPLLVAEQLHDLQVFERLMRQFCTNFYPSLTQKHSRQAHVSEHARDESARVDTSAPESRDVKAHGIESGEQMTAEHKTKENGTESTMADANVKSQDRQSSHGYNPIVSNGVNSDNDVNGDGEKDDDDDDDLAHEALSEAFEALQCTVIVLRTLLQEPDAMLHMATSSDRGHLEDKGLSPTALHAFRVIPSLLLIQIAFCRIPPGWTDERFPMPAGLELMGNVLPTPPQLFQYSWRDYEAALPGFAAAETAALSLADRYTPIIARITETLNTHLAMSKQEAHVASGARDEGDAGSDYSNEEVPAAMTQSMPMLESTKDPSPLEESANNVNDGHAVGKSGKMPLFSAMNNMAIDDSQAPRSRASTRSVSPLAPRLWRRNASQGPKTALQNALPPRVSRAHATSSFGLSRGRRRSPSPGLPRKTAYTPAHMQRDALHMFDYVLRSVPESLNE